MNSRIACPADVASMSDVRTSVVENQMSVEALACIGVTPDTVAAILAGDSRAWVAEEDGRIVAFSMADTGKATVFAMFVRPGHEGVGLGRALMTEAEQWLFSRRCEEIRLSTDRDPRVRAHGFYQHLGWRDDGIQEDGQVRYTKRSPNAAPHKP
jgi:GNAT superfamily N-acetyltransferase